MASTSTGAGTGFSSELLDEIKAFFAWNPPQLILGRKSTTATHPPAFFDKHFSEELILKTVKRLPSLVKDLATIVDKALNTTLDTLPSLADDFITAKQRKADIHDFEQVMMDEKAVASYYEKSTARYCSRVATTLALHPTAPFSQWASLLSWSQSGSSSAYAIVDGQLRFTVKPDDEDWAAILRGMDGKIRPIFEEIMKLQAPLATWEIKSLSAGPGDVMTAVPNLGKFSWTRCTAPDCLTNPKHEKAKEQVNQVTVGPDARAPPWKLDDLDDDATLHRSSTRQATRTAASGSSTIAYASPGKDKGKKHEGDDENDDATLHRPTARQATRTAASGSSTIAYASPGKDKGKKRKRNEDDDDATLHRPTTRQTTRAAASSSSTIPGRLPLPSAAHTSSKKDKGKKRKQDDDDDDNDNHNHDNSNNNIDNNNNKAYQDRFDVTAQSIVQQAWAQAVRVDGTVIILHSGNYELVCLRHRSSQTLYVSDIIEPYKCVDPGYGKLHVGIYIAAIEDMIDRKQQQLQLSQLKPPSDGGRGDTDQDENQGPGSRHKGGHQHVGGRPRRRSHRVGRSRFGGSAGRAGPTDELVAIEKLVQVASNHNAILLYLRYDIYDSPHPALFLRSTPSIIPHIMHPLQSSPQILGPDGLEGLVIVLTSEIGRGATGVVLRGTHKPGDSDTQLDVAVKLAFNTEQRDALRREYEVYCCLRSKGVHRGIATPLGFFDDSEGAACALVMLYAGVPLSTKLQDDLTLSDRKSALSTLESIHHAGVLHGDIRRENILTSPSGVTIIDFGNSRQGGYQRAKDQEIAHLCDLLEL